MPRGQAKFRRTLELRLIELTGEYHQLLVDLGEANLPLGSEIRTAMEEYASRKLQEIKVVCDKISAFDEISKCQIGVNIEADISAQRRLRNSDPYLGKTLVFPTVIVGGNSLTL